MPRPLAVREVVYQMNGMLIAFNDNTNATAIYSTTGGGLDLSGLNGPQREALYEFNIRNNNNIFADKRFDPGAKITIDPIVSGTDGQNIFSFFPYKGQLELWKFTKKNAGDHISRLGKVYRPRKGKRFRRYVILGEGVTQYDGRDNFNIIPGGRKKAHFYQFHIRNGDFVRIDPHTYKLAHDFTVLENYIKHTA